jgi:hypothetical protein
MAPQTARARPSAVQGGTLPNLVPQEFHLIRFGKMRILALRRYHDLPLSPLSAQSLDPLH